LNFESLEIAVTALSMAAVNKIDLALKYNRRHPEQGLLYQTVEAYWPVFLKEQEKLIFLTLYQNLFFV
jgi:hypothetical protein